MQVQKNSGLQSVKKKSRSTEFPGARRREELKAQDVDEHESEYRKYISEAAENDLPVGIGGGGVGLGFVRRRETRAEYEKPRSREGFRAWPGTSNPSTPGSVGVGALRANSSRDGRSLQQ